MSTSQASGLKRFLLWDYPRTSWQYDVMVALILAFIFLTPSSAFRDRPKVSDAVRLPSQDGASVFWVEPQVLAGVTDADRNARVQSLLRTRFGRSIEVVRLEPISGSEHEVKGFMAFTKP